MWTVNGENVLVVKAQSDKGCGGSIGGCGK